MHNNGFFLMNGSIDPFWCFGRYLSIAGVSILCSVIYTEQYSNLHISINYVSFDRGEKSIFYIFIFDVKISVTVHFVFGHMPGMVCTWCVQGGFTVFSMFWVFRVFRVFRVIRVFSTFRVFSMVSMHASMRAAPRAASRKRTIL